MHDDIISAQERLGFAKQIAFCGDINGARDQIIFLDLIIKNIPDSKAIGMNSKRKLEKSVIELKKEVESIEGQ